MSTPTERRPIYYTFGNHMHWADMEWLWGYHVLPDSIDDMLRVCAETGAHGHINFDAIAYEKLAGEAPQARDRLRAAIAAGTIEVVGGSYGQPYGLFHGGESNVRQLLYGVRTVVRLLDVRPRLFWEEEFYFFPQLPQLLVAAGYTAAALFFKETWHTPFVPKEETPVIQWEGVDGSSLPTLSRNTLNVRQWPEEFRRLRARLEDHPWLERLPVPLVLQRLELMPSPDWMCRAEVMLPQLHKLMDNPDFDVHFVTLSEYLEAARGIAEPRRYTMDDVFPGMSIGKNGDLFRRLSRTSEQSALAGESLAALLGFFRRPYAQWDVYPTWELEEAWRELLAAQHHDNDECEGLCGHIGLRSYERSLAITDHILTMYDAWDEEYFVGSLDVNVRIVPHGPLAHADRWKMAQAFVRPLLATASDQPGGDLPPVFAGLWCNADNVAVVAFYRETEDSGAQLEDYAARGIGYPYVVRLVEWNGQPAHVHLAFPGHIAAAYRTYLMGEREATLQVEAVESPVPGPLPWHAVTIEMGPHEIATLSLDLVQGRKVTRDLDSHRSVWATSHWITKES